MAIKVDPNSLGFFITDSARMIRVLFERGIAGAGLGLTAGEARALLHVETINGSRQLEIANRMGIEPMTVCTFLDRLQALDLIERLPDPNDRRAKNVYVTEKSRPVVAAIREEIAVLMDQATEGLSDAERGVLKRAMAIVRTNLLRSTQDDKSS
ncbi:MarR family transcriptional regulator [Rhizobiaceae bacterium n13]|uniref:MarR family transcriptional regulator n=1 Tax=Ferirhizobium litorale TaxID=2927786 RepID=A0AAE3QIH3_9HYPH|nr:MarR family transcriptional regulator [Fererhizobium litorale]MDI7862440.1 MarR family transcriptional regulator [Fererhizobium litorale]MDI7923673.1 MarR family transcriptional regulator [Fererhizobium litorale]